MSEVMKCVNEKCRWNPIKRLRKPLGNRKIKCDFCGEEMVEWDLVRNRRKKKEKECGLNE